MTPTEIIAAENAGLNLLNFFQEIYWVQSL